MRSAPTGASARAVDAFLSRYAARALFAATVAVALLSSEVAAAPRAVVLEIDGAIGPAVGGRAQPGSSGSHTGPAGLVSSGSAAVVAIRSAGVW